MIRNYTILSTNQEQLSSPYIQKLSKSFDFTLTVKQTTCVNFLLQYPLTEEEVRRMEVLFEPDALTLNEIHVDRYPHQTLITSAITPKDVGAMGISFLIPFDRTQDRATEQKLVASPFYRAKNVPTK